MKGVLELENHHSAIITVKIISGESHKCMLGGHFDEEQHICVVLGVLLQIAHKFQEKGW